MLLGLERRHPRSSRRSRTGARRSPRAPCTAPDVVLVDYRLPDLDGVETPRAPRRCPGAAVVALTAAADEPAVAACSRPALSLHHEGPRAPRDRGRRSAWRPAGSRAHGSLRAPAARALRRPRPAARRRAARSAAPSGSTLGRDAARRRAEARCEPAGARHRDRSRPRSSIGPAATSRRRRRRAIADLLAGQEATIECEVVSITSRPTRRRGLTISSKPASGTRRARSRRSGSTSRGSSTGCAPGTRVRLRGAIERGGGFVVRDYDLDGEGGGRMRFQRPSTAPARPYPSRRLRELVAQSLSAVADAAGPAARRPARPARASRSSATRSRRSTGRSHVGRRPRARAGDSPSRSCSRSSSACSRRRRGRAGEVAAGSRPAGRTGGPVPRRAAVHAHKRSGARDLRDRPAISRGPSRWSGCSKATSAPARPSSRSTRSLRAVERGYQGALMAPTETLAEQHFLTIEAICARALGSDACS